MMKLIQIIKMVAGMDVVDNNGETLVALPKFFPLTVRVISSQNSFDY